MKRITPDFNTHSRMGVIRPFTAGRSQQKFQYALPDGSDSETFTKSGIKRSYIFCQIAKCPVFIITGLWDITIFLSLFYKIPAGKPLRKIFFFQVKNGRFSKIHYGGTRYWIITIPSFLLFLIIWYFSTQLPERFLHIIRIYIKNCNIYFFHTKKMPAFIQTSFLLFRILFQEQNASYSKLNCKFQIFQTKL